MFFRILFFISFFAPSIFSIPVVCYYTYGKPAVIDVPRNLCSHVILIGSAHVSDNGELITDADEIEEFSELKRNSSNLKLLLCVTASSVNFSFLTSSKRQITAFTKEAISVLQDFQLDGLDIDWEFPVWSKGGKISDKQQFSNLLEILSDHLHKNSKVLSIAVSGPPTITKIAYDVKAISRFVDMVQIMNYDFHVFNKFKNPFVGFNAPLHAMKNEIFILGKMNSEASMRTWMDLGLPLNITYFGIPTYSRAFKLLFGHIHKPYSPAVKSLDEYTDYDTICGLLNHSSYKTVWNRHAASSYLYGGDKLWVSYEDERSILAKTMFAKKLGVAGIMIFSIGNDDVEGKCERGRYPLISQISRLAGEQ